MRGTVIWLKTSIPISLKSWYSFLYTSFLNFGKLVILGQIILFAEVGGGVLSCSLYDV